MTYARSILVPPGSPGTYHCVSRCVRRAWLCGEDRESGRSYEHRRQWVEDRIGDLAGIFAVAVWGYAVMSNHLHVVVQVIPQAAAAWSTDEVVARWLRLLDIPLMRGQCSGRWEATVRVLITVLGPEQPPRHALARKLRRDLSVVRTRTGLGKTLVRQPTVQTALQFLVRHRRVRRPTQPRRREALEHPLDGAADDAQCPRNQALAVPFLKVQTQ